MPTSRPFAYNTGSTISGTIQIGKLAVGTPTSGITGSPQGWNGPDEELGYVIAESVSGNTQPTPLSDVYASVGFFRSTGLTESSFIQTAQVVSRTQTFANGNAAYLWLSGNGYWSSWVYTNTGVTFSQSFTQSVAPTTAVEIAWNVFRTGLTGSYTTFTWSSSNGSSTGITHPTLVQTLANGLRTGTATNVTIDGISWRVGTGCGTPKIGGTAIEFSNVGSCSVSSTYALRPQINNGNWGGTNQYTVGAPSQTITLTFS